MPSRVALQMLAPRTQRRHLRRALVRVSILLFADIGSFLALRTFIRAVRDTAVFGPRAAEVAGNVVPQGLLGGFQFGLALIIALVVAGNYGAGDRRRDPARLGTAAALATALPLWASLWTVGAAHVLLVFMVVTVAMTIVLITERLAVDKLLRVAGFPETHPSRTVFVGTSDEYQTASHGAAFSAGREYQNLGYVAPVGPTSNGALGSLPELRRVLVEERAETVVVCGHLDDEAFKGVVQAAHDAGCELLSVPRQFTVTGVEPQMVWRRGQPLIELTSPAVKGQEQVLKRVGDVMASAAGLLALLPAFLVVAVAIKLDSRGPLFYQSPRWGRFGKRIGIWKFRTMVTNAAELLDRDPELKARFAANIKLEGDPRITRVGRILRRWSVDELPQLWNVLVGDLSLVGPRPKLIGEEEKYGAALETVLAVRPGITGLWQISGRNETSYEERIALDVKYASHPSFWEDLRILVRTVPVVLKGTGAH